MSLNLNKVVFAGKLGRDPELKALPNGNNVVSFSVASNRFYKDSAGEKKEEVTWMNCVAFGPSAERISQWFKKGDSIFVEGRIQVRKWDDKNSGETKYATEIVVDSFQNPESKATGTETKATTQEVKPSGMPLETIDYGDANVNVDDIPF